MTNHTDHVMSRISINTNDVSQDSPGKRKILWLRMLYIVAAVMCIVTGSSVVAHKTASQKIPISVPVLATNTSRTPDTTSLTSSNILYQYKLSDHVRLSICTIENNNTLIVDIRQFLNGKPTIKGIHIPLDTFKTLELMWDAIIHDLHSLETRT